MNTHHKKPMSLRKANFSKTTLALSIPGLMLGQVAMAQGDDAIVLDTLQIEERTIDTNPYAQPGVPYKAKVSGDPRRVKALAETPQTISVLTQTAIKESGKTDLKEVLAAQPGISLGTGENGNAFGDRYVIRGHEARSDVFVDGLRDPGMTTRESFAVEQVEITKGPSSTFAGRGSTGGAVNSITKQASTEYDFTKVEGGLGTDGYVRLTADSNLKLTEDLAARVNVLHSYEDVPDRDPADRERNGLALSVTYAATDKLNLTGDYYYLKAEDKPDLGSYIDDTTGKPNDDIAVYVQDEDFLDSEVETFTFHANYEFADNLSLSNATRYGTTDNGYVTTGASSRTPPMITIDSRAHQGWQEVEYFANQTNLFWTQELAGLENQFVFSLEYTDQQVLNGVYSVTNANAENCGTAYCIVDDAGNAVSEDINHLLNRQVSKGDWDSDYNIQTWSASVMDTIDFNDHWSLFLGLRADNFDYDNNVYGRGATTPTEYSYSDTLWNGHAGLVYNINDEANVYLTYSTSANINGGESDVGGSCGYGGLCGDANLVGQSKPEKTENIELGAKWNLMDEKLLATVAVFQITKDDVMESGGADNYSTIGTLNTGQNRVEGVEVSLVGNITDKFSVQFGASVMNAKVLESFNDGVNMTTDRGGNRVVTSDDVGKTLANFADNSAYLQLRYQLTDALSFGGAATYSSEVYTGQPDTAANEDLGLPSYTVYDFFATYQFSQQLSARLNVGNVTDEDYYLAAYRSGSFAYIGDRRNAQLSVAYEF
ncbi:TonB-dependent siderophore receptor [Aestuariicella hydrocarbonica]|uniref:TonB-dependent siderophore receptor n=1 Tax=Pseudomaricurvus hydrocarbonicus TaxID=1470433 RepID=A0A9E5JYX4_9GAMM|nr:TonB-dependent siderophore receptor [Aestuariicella hydrocarbonica]NHO64862.1 TonB-dependent siderophore receptor [Aestuariicella hydrocarbonica]